MNRALTLTMLSLLLSSGAVLAQSTLQSGVAVDSVMRAPSRSAEVISQDRMNKGLVTTPIEALAGQAAGVQVSSGADRMAMLSSVRVRGTTSLTGGNDPLVIIDNVYSDLTTLSAIYPADIESFTILKNAAETAPYGSRGASGVIVVETKKGSGGKFHVSYDNSIGFESVYKNLKMLRRDDYLQQSLKMGGSVTDGGLDNDFPSLITRTGFVQNHHIAFSGGSDQSNYRASVGYMSHNTVIRNMGTDNLVAKVDINQMAFADRLHIQLGLMGSSQQNKLIFDTQKLFYSAAAMNPTLSNEQNASGGWDKNANASQINPPEGLLREKQHEKNLNFNTHLGLDAKLLEGSSRHLNLHAMGSYSYQSLENRQYLPTWVWAQGQAYRGEHKGEEWLANLGLSYTQHWGLNNLQAEVQTEYQSSPTRGFWTQVKGFGTNDMGYDNLGAGASSPFGSNGSDYDNPSLLSFMASVNYNYANRYFISATVRADGSSLLGDNNKWGYFPSISATWDAKREAMLRHVDAITMLKVRTGYGLSGNLGGISSYNTLSLLSPNGLTPWQGSQVVTYGMLRNVNPDLKWETRSTFNIGMDLGLLGNRLVLTAEYYYSLTRDMLYQYDVSVPPFTYDKLLANIGKMSNQGLELGMSITPVQKRDIELNINLNLTYQRNRLKSLSGDYNGTQLSASDYTALGGLNGAGFHGGYNNIVYQIVGQPLGVFYLPHCTGLELNDDGTYSYGIADLDGNGSINLEDGGDRYIAGQATPKVLLGSNISLRYKQWDVSLQMNGAFGHKIYNGTSLTYMNMASLPDYNVLAEAPQRNIADQTATDYWLERGDYLNLDYLTVGWNVPLRKTAVLQSLRVSLSVNNLATITGYSGLTPMVNSSVVSSTLGIDDKRSYPVYRSYSVGVSVQF